MTEINVPCERVTLLLEDGKTVKIPLSEMEIIGEGKRPGTEVSADVIEAYSNVNKYSILESSTTLEVTTFTAEDKLADAVSCANCKMRNEEKEQSRPSRRPRTAGSVTKLVQTLHKIEARKRKKPLRLIEKREQTNSDKL